jgi:hypothetical protein
LVRVRMPMGSFLRSLRFGLNRREWCYFIEILIFCRLIFGVLVIFNLGSLFE